MDTIAVCRPVKSEDLAVETAALLDEIAAQVAESAIPADGCVDIYSCDMNDGSMLLVGNYRPPARGGA